MFIDLDYRTSICFCGASTPRLGYSVECHEKPLLLNEQVSIFAVCPIQGLNTLLYKSGSRPFSTFCFRSLPTLISGLEELRLAQ